MKQLENQKIIVSGSNGYLNNYLIKVLLEEGAYVYGIDIKDDKKIKHTNFKFFKCDICNEKDVQNLRNKIKNLKVNTLINGAAIDSKISTEKKYKSFSNYPVEQWRKTLDVNLIGSMILTKYICKNFENNNFTGNIINIASHYGVVAQDQRIYSKQKFIDKLFKPLEYGISKHALIGFSKNLAAYYQNTNIRVNTLSPGGVGKKNQNSKFVKNYKNRTISGRMAEFLDYKEPIIFLCKTDNRYLTGANLIVDGGASII